MHTAIVIIKDKIPTMHHSGLIAPIAPVRRLKSPKNAQNISLQRVCRHTLYIYVELLKPGNGKRPIRELKKLDRVTRLYRTAGNVEETARRSERARDKAIEAAVEIACEAMYRLRDEKTPFERVIVSEQADTTQAKKDIVLEYSLNAPAQSKGILSETMLRQATR